MGTLNWTPCWAYVSFAFLSVLLAILCAPRHWYDAGFESEPSRAAPPARLMSVRELSLHDGEESSRGLYVALLGQVFDVRRGQKHYGVGGAYHCMAGKDASLAFVTGDFTESGLTDDVSGLSPLQAVALYDWLGFYQRDYTPVGRLVGRFYTDSGQPTEALLQVEESLREGRRLKAQSRAERELFPPCNSEWSAANGGRVWCSTKSGGVQRDWVGVPRKLYSPGSSHSRCVCVKDSSAAQNPNLQEYEGCPVSLGPGQQRWG
ncbi:neuferricin [Lampris incognitus]|uniref:neuferricin n=1 Tax=Lampris incognitus TaxID=2546036 RepID=UPI0024B53EC9|nr:neuferricin [Lampris incognitus]